MFTPPNEYELLAYMALPPERQVPAEHEQQPPREAANGEGVSPPPAGGVLRRALRSAARLWRRL